MSDDCPIYRIYDAMMEVAREFEQLGPEIRRRLQEKEPEIFDQATSEFRWDPKNEDHDGAKWIFWGFALQVPVSIKRRRKPHYVSFRFDLWREPVDGTEWKHSKEALLGIGYHPDSDDPWENASMAITADGRLRDQNVWDSYGKMPKENGRLLVGADYKDKVGLSGSWLFAIPLTSLNGPERVHDYIVDPVVSLLRRDKLDGGLPPSVPAVVWNI